jgi:tRNA pseudouridine55 synthase
MIPEEGLVFLIDKDPEWTSFDVVNKIRYTLREKKVGHAGTLDPLATGLVIVCAGKATKRIDSFMAAEKEYTGTFLFGQTRPSHDLETEPDAFFDTAHITEQLVMETAKTFIGVQMQLPPMYSALKVNGKKLYELARKGKEAVREPRSVEIKEFEITRIALPEVDFRVVVSKGTYIRSLAYDFGKALHSGACLSSLRRTRIGEWGIRDALRIPDWVKLWSAKPEERENVQ